MKRNWIALIVAAGAFLAWMSYLGAKAWQYRHPPVIVSRAQLLGAEWDVIADVAADPADPKKPALNVTVREMLHSADEGAAPRPGQTVTVQNLAAGIGYNGAGEYVLPLTRRNGLYYLAIPPVDPGAPRSFEPRMYLLTDEVRRQFADIRAGRG